MKVIIAGSKSITDYSLLKEAIARSEFIITEVVSGCAPGVDAMGERYASENSLPVRRFPADWKEHGLKAGPIRNGQMASYGDALIAVWNGRSPGTKNMIELAKKRNLRVYIQRVKEPEKEKTTYDRFRE